MTIRRADLIAGALGVAAAAALSEHADQIPAAVLVGGALGTARRWPRATWIFVALVTVGTALVQSALPAGDGFILLAAAHGFAVGRFDAGVSAVAGAVCLTAAAEGGSAIAREFESFYVFVVPAAWAAGRALRARELLAARLSTRERELEQERDAYTTLSVRYERARIAAELHDIVAHAISLMVVQAGAGQRLATRDADATAETFAVIAEAARQAEVDMERLVALLSDGGDEPRGAGSDLAVVHELVARANRTGLDVTLRVERDLEELPPPDAQIVCRVVQEGLTNALRYAAGAPVVVRLGGEAAALIVEVANGPPAAGVDAPLRGTGTGNGLRGLRERIGVRGGSLVAGPTDDGGWLLAARVPTPLTLGSRRARGR